MELPSQVKDAKKHIYYVLTQGNLYAMSKSGNHEILQMFYKGEKSKQSRPRLLQMGILMIDTQFSVCLVVEGNSLLLLDPFSLQSFAAFTFPPCHLVDEFTFSQNFLFAHGRRHMFVVELDFESKGEKSVFKERQGIYEEHREKLIQPDIVIKRGLFEKERNITQALVRNGAKTPTSSKLPKNAFKENAAQKRSASQPPQKGEDDDDDEASIGSD